MTARARHIDSASLTVVVVTFALFAVAIVEKGLTHDLLLEAGVFMVSVKLILMNAKAGMASDEMAAKLATIQAALDRIESSPVAGGGGPSSRVGR
jgi:hypothetical protein